MDLRLEGLNFQCNPTMAQGPDDPDARVIDITLVHPTLMSGFRSALTHVRI